jgi:hypothetical protein
LFAAPSMGFWKSSSLVTTTPTAYWKLDEATNATRVDQVTSPAACNLAVTNTVTQAAGLITHASQPGSSALVKNTSVPAKMSAGSGSWELAGWVFLTSTSLSDLMAYSTGSDGFLIGWNGASKFRVSVNAAGGQQTLTYGSTSSLNAWHWVDLSYNGTTVSLNIDQGTPATLVVGPPTAATTWTMLNFVNGAVPIPGRMCEWAWWNGHLLTSAEKTFLYNSGAGRTYTGATGLWT